MHIAVGYSWFPTAAGYHWERALVERGHRVTFVGLGHEERAGYDATTPIDRIVERLPETPDLFLWIDPADRYFPQGIERLPIPTACYLIDVHIGGWRKVAARFFDAVFVAQKDFVEEYTQAVGHCQVYWLPLAAAPDVHRDHKLERIYDIGFVGNLAAAHRGTARARRLALLAHRYQTNDFYRHYPPSEVGEVYSRSRIVFNTSIAGDVTMRIFEGAAAGALVLTDSVANGLHELFSVGQEIVVFNDDTNDDADLLAKADFYLAQPDERNAIAAAGQRRTLAEHTYAHRADRLLATISQTGFRQCASLRGASEDACRAARHTVYTRLHMLDALLDEARTAGYYPARRLWSVLPCLARRLLL
ncbi:MAG: glycosyltransferase [Caldilineaceae bacterium]|nr:glycosyltransferase [Caldilineaceae bacterium]